MILLFNLLLRLLLMVNIYKLFYLSVAVYVVKEQMSKF